jgi:hypothetical protein
MEILHIKCNTGNIPETSKKKCFSIENNIAKTIDFDEIINNFAEIKARRIHL